MLRMIWLISILVLLTSCGTPSGGDHPPLERSPKLFRLSAKGDIACRNVSEDYQHNGEDCYFLDDYPENNRYYECFYVACKQKGSDTTMGQGHVQMSDDDMLMIFSHINKLQNSCKTWEDNKSDWLFQLKFWKISQVD